MNTQHVTTGTAIRWSALATGLALLFAGATACGSEDGTLRAASSSWQGPSSTALIEESKRSAAEERVRLDHEAARAHRFGDDQRTERHRPHRHRTASYRPGFDKTLPGNW